MPFVSYAQNNEDVVLWRALKHVEAGFYVDVGANDPVSDSITQAFYERGWRGINIEPVRWFYDRMVNSRPDDINLCVVASNQVGQTTLYEIMETGLSTVIKEVADKQASAGWSFVKKIVETTTINEVLAKHAKKSIHFLKIDVEGAESIVLEGLDLNFWRPWILVVEATKPSSTELNFENWEGRITGSQYQMVFFDGVNRFYLAAEHMELAEKFKTPLNIFDDYISVELKNAKDELQLLTELRKQVNIKTCECEKAYEELAKEREYLAGIRSDLQGVRGDIEFVRKERDRLYDRLNEVSAVANQAEAARNSLQEAQTALKAQFNEVMVDRHKIWTQLNEVWTSRAKIFSELEAVYHSRSYRITAPFRAVFGFARVVRGKIFNRASRFLLRYPRAKSIIKKLIKLLHLHRLVGYKPNNIDQQELILNLTFNEEDRFVTVDVAFAEDEKHFQKLFRSELAKRNS